MKKTFSIYLSFLLAFVLWLKPAFALEIQSVKSPSGIEAWLIEDHTLPIISLSFSFDAGNRLEPAGKAGLGEFAAALLDEGAGTLDANAFQNQLADAAISMNFAADTDYLSGHIKTLSKNRAAAFDLLRLAITDPQLHADAIERMRQKIIAEIKNSQSDPNTLASELWLTHYFQSHPYGQIRSIASVESITRADIKKFLDQIRNRRSLKIGVAGDITPTALAEILDKTFAALPDFALALPQQSFSPPNSGGVLLKKQTLPQTVAVFGQVGVRRSDADFYPVYIFNHILGGGGFDSMLSKIVREKNGLAYSVYTGVETMREAGIILGGVATKKEDFQKSKDLIVDIWRDFANDITDQQVLAAKQFLIGSFPLRFSSTSSISAILLNLQQENLGIDFFARRNNLVNAVTPDDVRNAAKKYLSNDRLLFAIVGDYKLP